MVRFDSDNVPKVVLCSPVFSSLIQKGMDDLTDWVVKHTVSNTPFVIK